MTNFTTQICDQKIIQSIDYMSCVSGGSWAAAAFAYYNPATPITDADFLGPITDPADRSISIR